MQESKISPDTTSEGQKQPEAFVSGFSFLNSGSGQQAVESKPAIDIFAQLNVKSSIGARSDLFAMPQQTTQPVEITPPKTTSYEPLQIPSYDNRPKAATQVVLQGDKEARMNALGFKPTPQPNNTLEEQKKQEQKTPSQASKDKPKGFSLKSAFNFMTGGILGGEAPKPKEEVQKP